MMSDPAFLFEGQPVDLPTLLHSREARVQRQQALLEAYGCPVICVLCNMPGPVKDHPAARQVHQAAMDALLEALLQKGFPPARFQQSLPLLTGPEGYVCIQAEAKPLKSLCCRIEQSHPYGRLMDLDVIGLDGIPLSRREFGMPPRACLVCGGPAADCVSRRLHTLEQVHAGIAAILQPEG